MFFWRKRPLDRNWEMLAVLLLATAGCSVQPPVNPPSTSTGANSPSRPESPNTVAAISKPDTVPHGVKFAEVAADSGVSFRYIKGAEGNETILETMGGGAGWLDYDRDGFHDLYFVQGGRMMAAADPSQPPDQFFRNIDGTRFQEVTSFAGLGDRGYGQGTSMADFDNDGFDDLYVTNYRHNTLYRNQGDGTFTDITLSAGVDETHWSTSCAWADLDLDGNLDLYVCNYVKFSIEDPQICHKPNGQPVACSPKHFEGEPDECFMNQGDGTFLPQAAVRGMVGRDSKSLGVAIADFNNDGLPDVFVSVDMKPNFLFLNQGAGRFQESAARFGCSTNMHGESQAGMGIAVGDFDRNNSLDLYLTAFYDDYNTLFQNQGRGGMADVTHRMRLAKPTMPFLGFGTVMIDFDQDGWMELFVANGHVSDLREHGILYAMPSQMFTYRSPPGYWFDISGDVGDWARREILGRGVACADYDNDGDLDLVVVPQEQPSLLLRNDSQRGHWLNFRFSGRQSNRSGIGTRVTVRNRSLKQMQELAGGTSYCSSHEHALSFGLGPKSEPCEVEIRWPSGQIQRLKQIPPDQSILMIEPEPESNP